MKILAAQQEAVQETIAAARQQLMKTSKGGGYQQLIQTLFVQVERNVRIVFWNVEIVGIEEIGGKERRGSMPRS